MKFLEGMIAVIFACLACLFTVFLACCVGLRILMWPIIVVCLVILAYCTLVQ